MIENASKDVAQYKRYKEVLGDYIGSLVNFGQMKYNDSEKWKIISEAYTDVKWQSQALKKKQIGEVHSISYKGTRIACLIISKMVSCRDADITEMMEDQD